jgi:hypothetical protein
MSEGVGWSVGSCVGRVVGCGVGCADGDIVVEQMTRPASG